MLFMYLMALYWTSLIPYPLYCGSIVTIITIDNGNIGFLLLSIILFPLIDWIAGFESKTMNISFILFYLFYGLIVSFLLISLFLFFICYESLILLLFIVLFLFIPTYYRVRTAFYFFIFSIFGSITYILSLLIFILSEWLISSLFLILIFFIKIPCFPFFYWLPEVHCEVDSSISFWLAGLLLKVGIYGILRFILSSFFLGCRFLSSFILSISLIGVIIVSCSCFRFFDLKKIIAFSSILHLNSSLVSIYSLNSIGILSGIITSLSHGFSSVGLFLFAGLLINKTYSRYLDSFFFIDSIFRQILLFFLLANLSFPGSFNLISEILTLINILFNNAFFSIAFLASSLLSSYYWFLILNRKLPFLSSSSSLNWIECFILLWLLSLIYFIGFILILKTNF